jgi:peptide/nickel transport system ATP-binding protein
MHDGKLSFLGEGDPGARGPSGRPLLAVSALEVEFAGADGPAKVVDGISFDLARGEVLAIVGESGSGKSVSAMSLVGLTRVSGATVRGSALLEGEQLIGAPESRLRGVRGARIAMVFQDPQSSLNPVHRVGAQIVEQIRAHEPLVGRPQALARAVELMERVGIPKASERVRAYPHELSGGQRQRVMIAMAMSLNPSVLLADEPTTALDVTVQAQILEELRRLRDEQDIGIVLITHDFGVVGDLADRVAVMRHGRIVEQGTTERVLREPGHDYTRELLQALVPPSAARRPKPVGGPLLEVEDLRVSFGGRGRRSGRTQALDGVSLTVAAGETLAVVGESGCGKTTLLRSVARLVEPDAGLVRLAGEQLTGARGRRLAGSRRLLSMVFQDPLASLNPRRRVGATLERSLHAHGVTGEQASVRALELLERVGLPAAYGARFPHELSGGERQRVGIARALSGRPRLVLLDEPVSSLDASLRRGVIELLAEVQAEFDCGYVLVSHDLGMVAQMADRIAVMYGGKVVELADADELLEHPKHPYTQELLAASPSLPGAVRSS